MYIQKTWVTGSVIEVEKVHVRKQKKDRQRKVKPTVECQKEVNKREAEKKLKRLINKNFHFGDYHILLTYEPRWRPADPVAAKNHLEQFNRDVRKVYKKLGKKYKYIAASGFGSTAAHHHLVLNGIDPSLLMDCWPYGRVKIFPLDRTGQYKKLASYIIKQTKETFSDPARRVHGKRWCQSTNLIIPKPKKKKVAANSWRQVPFVPKGYILEDFIVDVNKAGYPYQFYTLRKVNFFEV